MLPDPKRVHGSQSRHLPGPLVPCGVSAVQDGKQVVVGGAEVAPETCSQSQRTPNLQDLEIGKMYYYRKVAWLSANYQMRMPYDDESLTVEIIFVEKSRYV